MREWEGGGDEKNGESRHRPRSSSRVESTLRGPCDDRQRLQAREQRVVPPDRALAVRVRDILAQPLVRERDLADVDRGSARHLKVQDTVQFRGVRVFVA